MSTITLKTMFDPNKYVPPLQLWLTRVGQIEISTVRLPKMMDEDDRFETCLFHDDGTSDVVQTYYNRTEANFGHMRIASILGFVQDRGI